MATLVLSAVGTAIGGPLGGAIGALIGNQFDQRIFKPSGREGPRLKELAITTSSYGMPIPRHFGTVRAAGSIIWATELIESSEKVGGGKGSASTVTYSYNTSFAVALASRPIASVGRIWADGNLLRGAAGDLKVGGQFRYYLGYADQLPDPLIVSAEGAACPAFRGLAYCVFESLQLADFGNRIPALTFEIVAENGEVNLADVLAPLDEAPLVNRPLTGLAGFSDEGGNLGEALATLGRVYPISCDASGGELTILTADLESPILSTLAEAVVDPLDESFGGSAGSSSSRITAQQNTPSGIRYYDVDRDYQTGLQRAGGRARPGRDIILEFPGALHASGAQALIEQAIEREGWSQDRLNWRIAELDPALAPGTVVRVPDRSGRWRIEAWEWRESGIELELLRQPNATRASSASDSGRSLVPKDSPVTQTLLQAFELPWDGLGASDVRQAYAAPSSTSNGWAGAIIYADRAGGLVALQGSGNRRSITGTLVIPLPSGGPHFIDRSRFLDIHLDATDQVLASTTIEEIAQGANRALVGSEIIQFAFAENLGNGIWRLAGLLRGRGGTEHHALNEHAAGTKFALLDSSPVRLDSAELGDASVIAALGLADTEAVFAPIIGTGATLRPLTPVHPKAIEAEDGSLVLCWTRRARGAWAWNGTVEPPLVEQSEAYEVGLGEPDLPFATWQVGTPQLVLAPSLRAQLLAEHGTASLWVRQIGSFSRSEPLFLTSIS